MERRLNPIAIVLGVFAGSLGYLSGGTRGCAWTLVAITGYWLVLDLIEQV